MSETVPLIEVIHLCRLSRHGEMLLEDINFQIYAGERWAISGPSGAGKTLLMRCLTMLDASTGDVLWKGHSLVPREIPAYRSDVTYLAQSAAVIDGSVEDNLKLPISLHQHREISWSEQKVKGWCDRFRKDETFLKRNAHDLSGGERQIVALLRALLIGPSLLLLDEATSALDTAAQRVYEQFVEEWLAEEPTQRAVVWVTHSEEQRRRMADRELKLVAGRIAAEGA